MHPDRRSRLLKNIRNRLADKYKVTRGEIEWRWVEALDYPSVDSIRNWLRTENSKRPSDHALRYIIELAIKEKVVEPSVARALIKELPEPMQAALLALLPDNTVNERILIVHNAADQPLADLIARSLSSEFRISFDTYKVRERFLDELKKANAVIILYTMSAARDEFFNTLLEDVRLQYRDNELLTAVLLHDGMTPKVDSDGEDQFHLLYWPAVQDQQPRVIAILKRMLWGDQLADEAMFAPAMPVGPLELDDMGAISIGSPYYIERISDKRALNMIRQPRCNAMVIKGPRQVGKTSLLWRVADAAREAGKRVVEISFQQLLSEMDDLDRLLYAICAEISRKLQLEDQLSDKWVQKESLLSSGRFESYLLDCVLQADERQLVLAMDQVDVVFGMEFQSDFFGVLRGWVNATSSNTPKALLMRRLELVLVTSTEPHLFIPQLQSPFNVVEPIVLHDFNVDQTADLNRRHGSPLQPTQIDSLFSLLNGHPHLTRRALNLLASGEFTFAELLKNANDSVNGPFSSHLESLWYGLPKQPDILKTLKEILDKNTCKDEKVRYRLEGAGLVRRVTGNSRNIQARCKLYEIFLKERLRK